MRSLQMKCVIGSSTPLKDCGFNMLLIWATLLDAHSAGTRGPGEPVQPRGATPARLSGRGAANLRSGGGEVVFLLETTWDSCHLEEWLSVCDSPLHVLLCPITRF